MCPPVFKSVDQDISWYFGMQKGGQRVSSTCIGISVGVWGSAFVLLLLAFPTGNWLWLVSAFKWVLTFQRSNPLLIDHLPICDLLVYRFLGSGSMSTDLTALIQLCFLQIFVVNNSSPQFHRFISMSIDLQLWYGCGCGWDSIIQLIMTCIKYTPQVLLSSTARLDTWNHLYISVCMSSVCHTDCDSLVVLIVSSDYSKGVLLL
jgi:hypothetical protein